MTLTHSIHHNYPNGVWCEGIHPAWITVTHPASQSSVKLYTGTEPAHATQMRAVEALTALVGDELSEKEEVD